MVDSMGIRYYAYAFDNDQTEQALADPEAFVASDPLADAWGFEPHAVVATATMEQAVPKQDMLYLDKLWWELQAITAPTPGAPARPSYRMFEGDVTMCREGWAPWFRALAPTEMAAIARDLAALQDDFPAERLRHLSRSDDFAADARVFLDRARVFVDGLVAHRRGMVYMIG